MVKYCGTLHNPIKDGVELSQNKVYGYMLGEDTRSARSTRSSKFYEQQNLLIFRVSRKRQEKRSFVILFTVVITFLVCNVFQFAVDIFWAANTINLQQISFCSQMNKYYTFYLDYFDYSKKVFQFTFTLNSRLYMPISMTVINDLSYIMVTINCSVNFIIYCFLGESFRKEMKKMAEESREQFKKWL